MTYEDEIVKEIRQAREAYAAKFDYDLKRIAEDLKQRQAKSNRKIVNRRAILDAQRSAKDHKEPITPA